MKLPFPWPNCNLSVWKLSMEIQGAHYHEPVNTTSEVPGCHKYPWARSSRRSSESKCPMGTSDSVSKLPCLCQTVNFSARSIHGYFSHGRSLSGKCTVAFSDRVLLTRQQRQRDPPKSQPVVLELTLTSLTFFIHKKCTERRKKIQNSPRSRTRAAQLSVSWSVRLIAHSSAHFVTIPTTRSQQQLVVRSPFRAKHHVVMQYMAAGPKCPLPPRPPPLDPRPPYRQHAAWLVEGKEDKEELMNKEELMTLPTLQGTSHCSCLEHCFSL